MKSYVVRHFPLEQHEPPEVIEQHLTYIAHGRASRAEIRGGFSWINVEAVALAAFHRECGSRALSTIPTDVEFRLSRTREWEAVIHGVRLTAEEHNRRHREKQAAKAKRANDEALERDRVAKAKQAAEYEAELERISRRQREEAERLFARGPESVWHVPTPMSACFVEPILPTFEFNTPAAPDKDTVAERAMKARVDKSKLSGYFDGDMPLEDGDKRKPLRVVGFNDLAVDVLICRGRDDATKWLEQHPARWNEQRLVVIGEPLDLKPIRGVYATHDAAISTGIGHTVKAIRARRAEQGKHLFDEPALLNLGLMPNEPEPSSPAPDDEWAKLASEPEFTPFQRQYLSKWIDAEQAHRLSVVEFRQEKYVRGSDEHLADFVARFLPPLIRTAGNGRYEYAKTTPGATIVTGDNS